MGGSIYRIPMSGTNIGKPEKIYGDPKVLLTNDHALSWTQQADRRHRYLAAIAEKHAKCGGYS
jgi:hypothetical protein